MVLTTGAGGEALVLDPQNEATANAPLWLHSGGLRFGGIALSADGGHSYPPPEPDAIWVSSPETEGELRANTRPGRRTISVTLLIREPDDATATNKALSPTAGPNLLTWGSAGTVIFERVTTLPARLDGFDTAVHVTTNSDDDSCRVNAGVTASLAETFTAWVYVVSGTVRLELWTSLPSFVQAGANITTGSWQRVALPYTPGSSDTWSFRVAQNGAGTAEWYVTGVQIGPADPYFDGDTPGCYWTGTRMQSSSVRRATGGARYVGIRSDIEDKIAKLDRYGGTLRRTLPSGDRITFDVIQARVVEWQEDVIAELRNMIRCELEFVCKPYGRGDEVTV